MRTRREFIVLLGGAAAVRRSSAQDRPARILYFTHSAGYRHDVIPTSRDVLQRIGATSDFQITMSEDVAVFTTENLLRYGGIMFFTTGELPLSDAQRRAFTDFIRAGGGFLGVHSATDTFYQWPEYWKIIGGYFDQHPWHQAVVVEVADRDDPLVAFLGEIAVTDEIYQIRDFDAGGSRVLLRLGRYPFQHPSSSIPWALVQSFAVEAHSPRRWQPRGRWLQGVICSALDASRRFHRVREGAVVQMPWWT
jgi:uncharacterized protein